MIKRSNTLSERALIDPTFNKMRHIMLEALEINLLTIGDIKDAADLAFIEHCRMVGEKHYGRRDNNEPLKDRVTQYGCR